MGNNNIMVLLIAFLVMLALALLSKNALAHCDGMDGPVVKAAQKALETGEVNRILIWVQKNDEEEIKKAFQKTLAVRKLSPEAKDLADMYFFETLVRTHRAGEGAPYTGIKPAGRDLGAAIPAADKAVEDGNIKPVIKLLTDAVQDGIEDHFKMVTNTQKYNKDDVNAGREYVEAYVVFLHYVEGLYDSAKKMQVEHAAKENEPESHHHK